MAFVLSTPRDIYHKINEELLRITASLRSQSTDEALNQAQNEAHSLLIQYQTELQKELAGLEKNAEWNTFTIAFYGETGAGKSTIIETLRILLQEPGKLASQQAFRELKSQYDQNEDGLRQLQQTVDQLNTKLGELVRQHEAVLQQYELPYRETVAAIDQVDRYFDERVQQFSSAHQQHEQLHRDALAVVTQLQALVTERRKTASPWQKLLSWFMRLLGLFRKMQEEIELGHAAARLSEASGARDRAAAILIAEHHQAGKERLPLEQQLNKIVTERDNDSKAVLIQQTEAEQHLNALTQQQQEKMNQLTELQEALKRLADGEIIGDGRADFTRVTQCYNFELNSQPFALLDVPGIEGKEGLVLREIERAVQTAHAVFYVTNQPAPPQTGDEKRKGTLEKIKEHLGAQTEVWTIYNKKITSPKHSLSGRLLTSEDENASLAVLDGKMREHLGEHYREVFPLSAHPAFLASTDHFAPDSQNANRRRKILADFNHDELLEKTQVRAFLQLLSGQLIQDSKAKITRANFNKANEALNQGIEALGGVQRDFVALSEKLNQDGQGAKTQLSSSFRALKQRLESRGEIQIDDFASKVRNKMYDLIDDDISNDYFKDALKDKINSQQEMLRQQIPEAMTDEIKRFQRDAEEIIKRFEDQAQELTALYSKLGKTRLNHNFDFKIKIDNGIKVGALVSSLLGIALAPFTGGASLWVLAGSAIGVLVSLGKAVWAAFSTDYKKSQQRKSTDENLRSITEQLRKSLRESLKDTLPNMQQKISLIEQAIEAPAKQAVTQVQVLTRSINQLQTLSLQIDNAGKRK